MGDLTREVLLGKTRVNLGERGKIAIVPSNYVEIDSANLTKEITEHSGNFCYIASLHSEAIGYVRDMKAILDSIGYDVDIEIRTDFETRGEKKPAEAALDKMVKNDERYTAALVKFREAEDIERRLSVIREAMGHRKTMLESLGRITMQEMAMDRPFLPRKDK